MEDRHPEFSFGPILASMVEEYAAASGDSNSIHLDPEVAQSLGYSNIVVHGMILKAQFLRLLGMATINGRIVEFASDFRAVVVVGDTVTFKLKSVEEVEHEVGDLKVSAAAYNQDGQNVATARLVIASG